MVFVDVFFAPSGSRRQPSQTDTEEDLASGYGSRAIKTNSTGEKISFRLMHPALVSSRPKKFRLAGRFLAAHGSRGGLARHIMSLKNEGGLALRGRAWRKKKKTNEVVPDKKLTIQNIGRNTPAGTSKNMEARQNKGAFPSAKKKKGGR